MKALVLLSGGQDSTTCLWWALKEFGAENVRALSINYGQRHAVELHAAVIVAKMAKVEHSVVNIPIDALLSTSPLVDRSRDVEEYADADSLPGGLEDTFVPFRNLLFLTIAGNHAMHHGCGVVVTGVSEEDYGGYPDCRSEFITAMQEALNQAIGADPDLEQWELPLQIHTPLIALDKAATVHLALALTGEGGPYGGTPSCMEALAYSHTCYNGSVPPCGRCHACLLRSRGFEQAGVTDPLVARVGRPRA
jgi:7-cyano-7-deazaguanine synthase